MINKSTIKRFGYLSAIAAAFVLVSGNFMPLHAQRDPFKKAAWATPRKPGTGSPSGKSPAPGLTAPVNYGPPAIEARIEYFKRLRESAAANGQPLPKVTSVMTLNEMAVTGIFKTPRGYAAMVEATPIKLSYTIYPGEKFFDGQLVAVEENRLVFRKVTKVGSNKFVASVENKPLRQYSTRSQIEGTAPVQPTDRPVQIASSEPVPATTVKVDRLTKIDNKKPMPASNPFASPLDEMNNLPVEPETDKSKKGAKKPVKVAKNKEQ